MNKWEKEVFESLLDSEATAISELEKQYKNALNEINQKVKLYQADIDMLDAALNQDGLDESAKALLLSQKRSKIYQQQFQQALKDQVSGILDRMQGRNYSTIEGYLKSCYEDSYVGTLYDLAQQGIPVMTPINQASAMQSILLDSKVSEGYYARLGADINKLKKTISQEISRGIASSLSYSDIARNIDNVAKTGLSNAKRIARTEGHRIQNTAARDAALDARDHGADLVKVWDSTLDSKTRPSHRMVDGEIRELDEKFSNGLDRPGDPNGSAEEVINCRCAEVHKPRWDAEGGFAKVDNETGEILTFNSPKDYADFKEKYWSKENLDYMDYVHGLETKYGTTEFSDIVDQMSDSEYNKLKNLEESNPLFKMAASESENDWSLTTPRNVSKQERSELIKYAKEKGVRIGDIKSFDGDHELLKSQIDSISSIQKELPLGKNIVLNVGHLSDDDFGSTQQQTITINRKALRNRIITEENINVGNLLHLQQLKILQFMNMVMHLCQ